jgi:hypothetical protein
MNKNLTPKYTDIKVPNIYKANKKTKKEARITRIKDDIKSLYKNKYQPNRELYRSRNSTTMEEHLDHTL